MGSMKQTIIAFAVFCIIKTSAEPPVPQGIRPSNILGGAGQHASFSFIRPGLTQTSYSFNGPSSHQAFSSSIGNPNLAQKVLPNVANALAYRNPGLGYFSNSPIATAYASSNQQYPSLATGNPASAASPVSGGQVVYQGAPIRPSEGQVDQATALAYLQQQYRQQYQQQYLQAQQQYQAQNFANQGVEQDDSAATYQAQLAQLHAIRQAQAQTQSSEQSQQIPEQLHLQQQEQQQQQQQQTQNLLGVAYSSAPSVAHVKVSGNGYNFDF